MNEPRLPINREALTEYLKEGVGACLTSIEAALGERDYSESGRLSERLQTLRDIARTFEIELEEE